MAKYKKRKDRDEYYTYEPTGQYNTKGKPIYKKICGRTVAEVDEKVRQFHVELAKGIVTDKKMKVGEWADIYYDTYVTPLRPNTRTNYKNSIEKHIKPAIGNMRMVDVKQHHLQKLLNDVAGSTYGTKNKPYSEKTVKEIRSTLYAMFNHAVLEDIIPKNPAAKLKSSGKAPVIREALTKEQQEIALAAAPNVRIGDIILIMYYCGLRRGEVLALTVDDIQDGWIVINKQVSYPTDPVTGRGKHAMLGLPKTNAGVRKVPIPYPLIPVLKQCVKRAKAENRTILFPGSDNGYLSASSIKRGWEAFENYCNKISDGAFGHVVEHQLRHTYCTCLFEMGVDMKTASKYAGHDDIETTLKIYTHLREEQERQSTAAIQNWSVNASVSNTEA